MRADDFFFFELGLLNLLDELAASGCRRYCGRVSREREIAGLGMLGFGSDLWLRLLFDINRM